MNIDNLKKIVTEKLHEELPAQLSYHNVAHTLHVYEICQQYIERSELPAEDAYLLRTAALMHDTGFIWSFENHEDHSISYTKELLPAYGYSPIEIEIISNIIAATKIPQRPTTLLEQIIGDADLDYLGTELFYSTGDKLYNELIAMEKISSRKDWNSLQIRFLEKHHYHTAYAQKYREPVKQKFLKELKAVSAL